MIRRWCPDCRKRQPVVDVSTEGGYAHGREYAIRVEWLACGDYVEGDQVDAGPAPGAPEPMPRSWALAWQARAEEFLAG